MDFYKTPTASWFVWISLMRHFVEMTNPHVDRSETWLTTRALWQWFFSLVTPVDASICYPCHQSEWHRPSHASFRCPQPRHLHGRCMMCQCQRGRTSQRQLLPFFAILRQLRSVRRSVPRSVLQSVTGVVSRSAVVGLAYGNATLADNDIPSHLIKLMQSVMNSAVRLVFSASRYDRITPLLTQLHWRKVWSASSLSWLFWYIHMPTPDSSAVPCRGTPSVMYWWGSSASLLCIDIIACCPTHPSFNHRRSSFSGRCCPTVEHSAAESHVVIINVCFQETFEDTSLQSFFPWISCSACVQVTLSFWTL